MTKFNESDKYAWLRDPNWPNVTNPEILQFLNKYNQEFDDYLSCHQTQVERLFSEIKGRIAEDDQSYPILKDDYQYWSFIKAGQEYWTYARKKNGNTEILLDINQLAENRDYCNVANVEVSPNHRYIAYAVDYNGDEKFTVFVKDLNTGEIIDCLISNAFPSLEWDKHSLGFYYLPTNEYWRADKLFYHQLGCDPKQDLLLLHEQDATFRISIAKSESEQFLFVYSSSSNENECYTVNLDEPLKLSLFAKRIPLRKNYLSHHEEHFYIRTNDTGRNFRLARTDVKARGDWQELIAHNNDVYLENVITLKDHLIIETKELGLPQIIIMDYKLSLLNKVEFAAPSYHSSAVFTTFDTIFLRYNYSALNQPQSVYEINLHDFSQHLRKQQAIPSGFDSHEYTVERVFAPSANDPQVMIPISLVYKREMFKHDGSNPLYLYGYGSYGYAIPSSFRSTIVSLLDRGFVYAIAHIRGGDDLGYDWYESAKYLTKKRTFEDFIDCALHLCKEQYSSAGNIAIAGGSAGGMLVGACMNMRPDLYRAVIAHVPFVDVLNTMLDETLPLTPGEFNEWGNPKNPEFYEYIKSYSPYDNIESKDYPALFVTAGLTDPRVTYWEPAKWVAKLNELKTDSNQILFKTNMGAGHAGKSGRFEHLREYAEEFCFVLETFGINE